LRRQVGGKLVDDASELAPCPFDVEHEGLATEFAVERIAKAQRICEEDMISSPFRTDFLTDTSDFLGKLSEFIHLREI
jgi:hypothetical protein